MSKSFLSELIGIVRSKLKIMPSGLETAINDFRTAITDTLDKLSNDDNLRIYDDNHGGVVRGLKRSRRVGRREDDKGILLCDISKFKKCAEFSYFRAVFNLPRHSFKMTDNSEVRLIGYESPLMRKKRGRSSRATACDLIGLTSDSRILCIEGKVKPYNPATNIVYGLLESFAYGVCVEYFLSDESRRASFEQEVQFCLRDFHGQAEVLNSKVKLPAAFTLAAPREYFAEYFNPTQTGTGKKHGNLISQLIEAEQLLTAFHAIEGPKWAGFMIMDTPCTIKSFNKARNNPREINVIIRKVAITKTYVEPHFKSEPFKVDLAWDINELKDNLLGT